jgi:hypothetical protein
MPRKMFAALGVLAVAALPVASASADKPDHPAKPAHPAHPAKPNKKPDNPNKPSKPKGTHPVAYKFKGVVKAADEGAKTLTVTVGTKKGDTNKRSRSFAGQDVTFDVSKAHFTGHKTLADAKPGVPAKVLAKLPKDGSATQPFAAKRVTLKVPTP